MGKVEYTSEQKRVIELRDSNILVSAAAGSGKTAVLTERIMSLITGENPIDIDRMLVLTYTTAAAAEMRGRISEKIAERIAANPGDSNLWRQSTLLLSAKITTIDSFCLFVIRNNFSDIGLDPGFRIMDEGERKLLLRDTVTDIFERHFADENDASFRHLIDCYGKVGNDQSLAEILIGMYTAVMSNPDPLGWLDAVGLQSYEINGIEELQNTLLWKCSEAYREGLIDRAVYLVDAVMRLCESEDGPEKYIPTVMDYSHLIHSLKEEHGYERRYRLLNNSEITRLSTAKGKNENPDKRAEAKKLIDQMKDVLKKIQEFYCVNGELAVEDGAYVYKAAKQLVDLLKELITEFRKAKKEGNMLDFNDMEHYAYQILVKDNEDGVIIPTASAEEYRDYFDVVMVDEYQDSNYIQEHILKAIAKDNNYFMVGDVKQSIYKFRQACPDIFVDKYNTFEDEGRDVRIDLNKNFRSRNEVLDFANIIFDHTMHKNTASIQYDDKAKLYLGNETYTPGSTYKAEVLVLDSSTKSAGNLLNLEKHEAEALMVAGKIKQLMQEGFRVEDTDGNGGRPLKYGDIVILLRSTKEWDQIFKHVLESQGIPAYINLKAGYFSAKEVTALLDYLCIIDNPNQDVPLYGALVSYFGGFTPEEIAKIKAENKNKSLYEAIGLYDEGGLRERIDCFLNALKAYRHKSTYMQVRELIDNLLSDTGYLSYVSAMPDGDRRRNNVLMLLERASGFEQSSYHGLFHFNKYIEQLKASEVDYGESGVLGSNDDVVKIMSIHASKGLEFPICFYAGAGKQINFMDSKSSVLFDREAGLAFDYINPETCEKRKSIQKSLLSRKIKLDAIAEEIRVLYVALTRAREKMIVTGEADVTKLLATLQGANQYTDADILDVSTMLELMVMGLDDAGKIDEYIDVISYENINAEYVEDAIRREESLKKLVTRDYEVDEEICGIISERASFVYPYENLRGLAIKTSVSELKHAAMHEAEEASEQLVTHFETDEVKAYVPEFISGEIKENMGALRGSAVHRLMELLPFKEALADKTFIQSIVEKETATGRLSREYADLIPLNKCVSFLESNLAKRMMEADRKGKLFKEQSFFLGVPASRVKESYPETEIMLIQGIIDAYFEEDDYIVLMDYKTDAVDAPATLVSRYSKQLELYQEAIERITGKKVREKVIYSFAFGQEINL